jgi:cell division septal protein FtsQ
MRKQNSPSLIKKATIVTIVIFLAAFFLTSLWKGLKNSRYFKIKDVLDSQGMELTAFSYLKGRNIFNIDLKAESQDIQELYPNCQKIRLVRVMPNRLVIDFIKRIPVAYVKLFRFFCVDDEAVLFDVPRSSEFADLPIIVGLDTKIFGPKAGKAYNIMELKFALDVIKEIKNNKILEGYKIKRIDVLRPGNTSFLITAPQEASPDPKEEVTAGIQGLDIKIGQDDIKDKIATFSQLLIQLKKDWNNIRYIDLRFKEPVIKFKDAK